MALAVKVGAVATPELLVVAVVVLVPVPVKVPLAPEAGAVKVTVAFATGLLLASTTFACKAVVKAVETVALCGVPAVAEMVAAAPARLVREKFAGVATPETVAATV